MPALLSEPYGRVLSLRAMSALSSEHGGQYHTSDINYSSNVSTTIRVVSTLCFVEYSRPLSCMGKTIWMMLLVQCYQYQSGIGIIIRAWWAISALLLRWEQYYAVWSIIRARLAISSGQYWHYYPTPSDVSTTTRMMSLLSCVKYSKPLSCMSKTIRAMFLVQYHHYQSGVGIIIRAMSSLPSGRC